MTVYAYYTANEMVALHRDGDPQLHYVTPGRTNRHGWSFAADARRLAAGQPLEHHHTTTALAEFDIPVEDAHEWMAAEHIATFDAGEIELEDTVPNWARNYLGDTR